MIRNLPDAEGQRHYTSLQTKFTEAAIIFRGEMEREIQQAVFNGGFNAADQITARANVIAAIKTVLW